MTDPENRKVGRLVLFTDATEKIKVRNARELEERMSILGQMSTQIIHDIKNPLFVVHEYVKLLSIFKDSKDFQCYSQIMEQEINRILEITQEIQDFSRGDINITVSQIQAGTLNYMILELIKKVEEIFSISINCIVDNSHTEAIVRVDIHKLERALKDILINLVEAFSNDEEICIEIETRITEKNFLVYIKDKGKGISEDIRENIFRPFTSYKKSTGLGLSISKNIIEKHEGSLQLTEKPGWKTVFKVSLPINQN